MIRPTTAPPALINQCLVTLMFASFFLASQASLGSPPPPVTDPCSALRVANFSWVGDGDAPTKVMFGTMIYGKEISEQMAWQNARRSRVMGAAIPEDITTLPDHCLVEGYVNPHIKFEMRLPTPENWNGKFLHSACDGFCGKISKDATMAGMIRNYATMTTDGGHWGEHPFDGIWAKDNLQARIDFGYRANHVLLKAAKAIINEFYGDHPKRSYLTGCSKGGQAGVMSALRYPDDFDGILSRGPTINYTKVNALRCLATAKATVDDEGKVVLGAERVPLIEKAVMEHCDEIDGLKDRLISDPRKCDFDPGTLLCEKGEIGPTCLNAAEVDALRKLYAPITNKAGERIYAGSAYGSESSWPAWALPVDGNTKIYASQCSGEYLKYLAFRDSPGPDYDYRSFDWDRDRHLMADLAPIFDADNPNLRDFRDRGGKLMLIHGWADSAIPAEETIDWYEEVSQFEGGYDKAAEFTRLFLLPGVNHCDGGPGPYEYEALELLEKWVEDGEAPDEMLTRRRVDGEIERERPVYPYPMEAKYKGRGDIDKPESFKPVMPKR